MSPRVDVDELKSSFRDVRSLCESLGLQRATGGKFACVWCSSSDGMNVTVHPADRRIRVKCFVCEKGGDVFDLIAGAYQLEVKRDFGEVVRAACELAGRVDLLESPTTGAPRRQAPERAARVNAPTRPDAAEVQALWDAGDWFVSESAPARMLASRGLDPDEVYRRGLARVLPSKVALPAWAEFRGKSWHRTGFSIILPTYDAKGALCSVRAWRVGLPREDMPKRIAPKGCTVAGLVMADLFGAAMLRGECAVGHVVITEGEPDFLTRATVRPLLAEPRWAVLGVVAGSWTKEIAGRIPDGATVVVETDPDAAGDKYAELIAGTLGARAQVLRRRAGARGVAA